MSLSIEDAFLKVLCNRDTLLREVWNIILIPGIYIVCMSRIHLTDTSYYKVSNFCVSVCVCVCVCVCLCVCLSGYTFPQFSTDLLQMFREPSTGHDTYRGLYIFCLHATRALSARVCVHSLIF
jgi:hypothetical protein